MKFTLVTASVSTEAEQNALLRRLLLSASPDS